MPKLIGSIDADLTRFELRNVIYILSSFQKLYEQSRRLLQKRSDGADAAAGGALLSEKSAVDVHRMCFRYLNQYIS